MTIATLTEWGIGKIQGYKCLWFCGDVLIDDIFPEDALMIPTGHKR